MLSTEGKLSARYFLISCSLLLLTLVNGICYECDRLLNIYQNIFWLSPLFFVFLTVCIRLKYSGFLFQVAVRSIFLGTIFSTGIFIVYFSKKWTPFGLYMCVMSFFHYSEFLAISWCNPKTLSISSFLLNHSPQYNIAAVSSWIEFFLEIYFIPGVKEFHGLSYVGLFLCIIGEMLRKTAMATGCTNFAHIVQTEKDKHHELVTHGVYSLFRHPSYVGWFYWSIGTQILLLNPFCFIAYTIVSWRFFKERIIHEEQTLLYFFGKNYIKYQKSVGTGLPGISGYLIKE